MQFEDAALALLVAGKSDARVEWTSRTSSSLGAGAASYTDPLNRGCRADAQTAHSRLPDGIDPNRHFLTRMFGSLMDHLVAFPIPYVSLLIPTCLVSISVHRGAPLSGHQASKSQ